MTENSYPLKLIFLPQRLKRFHFFEWHSWDLAEVFAIWNSCETVLRDVIQEKASKLPRHPGKQLWVLSCSCCLQTANIAPLVLKWQRGLLRGPWVLLAFSSVRKKVRQTPRECSVRSELAVRVTEIMLVLRSPPTSLFFFVGRTIRRLFGDGICKSWA